MDNEFNIIINIKPKSDRFVSDEEQWECMQDFKLRLLGEVTTGTDVIHNSDMTIGIDPNTLNNKKRLLKIKKLKDNTVETIPRV